MKRTLTEVWEKLWGPKGCSGTQNTATVTAVKLLCLNDHNGGWYHGGRRRDAY